MSSICVILGESTSTASSSRKAPQVSTDWPERRAGVIVQRGWTSSTLAASDGIGSRSRRTDNSLPVGSTRIEAKKPVVHTASVKLSLGGRARARRRRPPKGLSEGSFAIETMPVSTMRADGAAAGAAGSPVPSGPAGSPGAGAATGADASGGYGGAARSPAAVAGGGAGTGVGTGSWAWATEEPAEAPDTPRPRPRRRMLIQDRRRMGLPESSVGRLRASGRRPAAFERGSSQFGPTRRRRRGEPSGCAAPSMTSPTRAPRRNLLLGRLEDQLVVHLEERAVRPKGRRRARAASRRIIAILMMSAAVPWNGAFRAMRSALDAHGARWRPRFRGSAGRARRAS